MMLMRDLMKMSLHNLLLHKVRSVLTSLGVIFGVGSVIAMLAVSEGAKQKALAELGSMGIDKIIVFSKKPPAEEQPRQTNRRTQVKYGLVHSDIDNISNMDNVESVSSLRNSRQRVMRGVTRLDTKLVGVDIGFLPESNSRVTLGRWFSPVEAEDGSMVAVLGSRAKRKMFKLRPNLLGDTVTVGKFRFAVIGILDNDIGANFPEVGDPNDMIFIPTATMERLMKDSSPGEDRIEYDISLVKVKDITYIDYTAQRITAYLQKTHDKQDWGVKVPLDLLKQQESTQNIFTIVMGSIAGISLIVGGIGIMNIMLASVFERRKEIGTRRALGAQKPDILGQFLIETVFLTSCGGILGIFTGIGLSQLITVYADMPTVYSSWSIIVSLAISSAVGVIFGTYPAWKAAQQNPIEVLRAE
ncbi:MAG: ABC transporter permease [Victivallaceae bacterium]|nr:ABC transporter permease [Victivallaceae bacterium]